MPYLAGSGLNITSSMTHRWRSFVWWILWQCWLGPEANVDAEMSCAVGGQNLEWPVAPGNS
jgi:hypothetical protein